MAFSTEQDAFPELYDHVHGAILGVLRLVQHALETRGTGRGRYCFPSEAVGTGAGVRDARLGGMIHTTGRPDRSGSGVVEGSRFCADASALVIWRGAQRPSREQCDTVHSETRAGPLPSGSRPPLSCFS